MVKWPAFPGQIVKSQIRARPLDPHMARISVLRPSIECGQRLSSPVSNLVCNRISSLELSSPLIVVLDMPRGAIFP